ncbi:hypothetical protein SADUNF_Sadunf10G0191500 [Salix dunnii]|uniref:Uncharacterized protein n=1 Tax=Salix dunnii TaxID=1413687 RepID=A0A835MZ97_9ROSI|nr:hypothetical protein SADUNF_Sadunf10G0191500 [Salix dunnii]
MARLPPSSRGGGYSGYRLEDTILSVAAKLHAAPPLKVFSPIFSLEQNGERTLTDKIRSRFNTTFLKIVT